MHIVPAVEPEQPLAPRDQRAEVIAGLRGLADFLDEHPALPAPKWVFATADITDVADDPETQRVAFVAAIRELGPQKVLTEQREVRAVREFAGEIDYTIRCPAGAVTSRQVDMQQKTDGITRRVEIVETVDWEALGVPA